MIDPHAWKERLIWRLDTLCGAFGIGVLVFHGLTALSHTVNVPLDDEWGLFAPGALDRVLNVRWLFGYHLEHRMLFTRLLSWALLRVGDLNLPVQATINFVMFACLCVSLVHLARRHLKIPTGFLLPLLACGMTHDVHGWAFQSHFQFYLIFFVAGLLLMTSSGRWSWLSPLAAFCSAYSFASGVICALSMFPLGIALGQIRPNSPWPPRIQGCLSALAGLSWFWGTPPRPAGHPPWAPPHSRAFWAHYGTLLARGFGFSGVPAYWVGLALLIVIGSVYLWQLRRVLNGTVEHSERAKWLALLVYLGGGLLAVMAISMGRGHFGVQQATDSRYLESVMVLIPAAWCLVYTCLKRAPLATGLCAIALAAPFADEFHYTKSYRAKKERFLREQQCVWRYYAGDGDGICMVGVTPVDIRPYLDHAKGLNVRFYSDAVSVVGLNDTVSVNP